MPTEIIDPRIFEIRDDVDGLYRRLEELTRDIGNADLSGQVIEIREKLEDPFLFVIVGEVKAGKSSFVNALLDAGRDVCKVAPDPCTDVIQQIVYGEEDKVEVVNQYLHQISVKAPILESISIVDTPGTNTIIDHHQEITERFIPHSDLIVFVFESKNPYRQSAWELYNYISEEWRKKVIFVLQQKDLMKPEDLTINIEGVRKQAVAKGISDPKVFAVSALQELQGNFGDSGFTDLRQYILDNITGTKSYHLKLESNLDTAASVLHHIDGGLKTRRLQYEADIDFRAEVREAMDQQEEKSNRRVDAMVDNLLMDYDRITGEIRGEFIEGLGFMNLAGRSFRSIFSSDQKGTREWMTVLTRKLEKQLRSSFQEKLEVGMLDISDSIKQMVKIVELKMQASKTILGADHEIFGDIADKRQEAIKAIQSNYTSFVENTENFVDRELFPRASSFVPDLAAGGGLAIIGGILAASAKGAIFDVTGGIISAIGFTLAGVTLFFRKRKVIASFDEEIAKGREELKRVLDEQIKTYTARIKERLDQNFDPLDVHIEEEKRSLESLESKSKNIDDGLQHLNTELKKVSV